jgi:hypothetical protein
MRSNILSLLSDFLRTEECQREFGWVECHGCDGRDSVPVECSEGRECKKGRIPAPWLKILKEEGKDGHK